MPRLLNNVYSVMVRAIAVRAAGDTGPAQTSSFGVDVTVTNVEEPGTIVLSRLQPEADGDNADAQYQAASRAITATLTDPDGDTGSVTWTWHASTVILSELELNNPTHWQTAPGEAEDNVFTPSSSAVGRYLRVTAGSYTDPAITDVDDNEVVTTVTRARLMAVYAVQAAEGGFGNGSPDFVDDSVELSVAENVPLATTVDTVRVSTGGTPATDRLTYSLRPFATDDATATGITPPTGHDAAADAAAFAIDQRTGQITVAQSLDFESRGTPDDGKYIVVVRAVDPSGLFDIIGVVITASDVNDNPVLTGQAELTILENEDETLRWDPNKITGINVYEVTDARRPCRRP